jgi:hypothetical protein
MSRGMKHIIMAAVLLVALMIGHTQAFDLVSERDSVFCWIHIDLTSSHTFYKIPTEQDSRLIGE